MSTRPELETGFDGCGIFEGVPFEVYESWAGLNKSSLWILKKSPPAQYHHSIAHGLHKRKKALDWGQALHYAALEPGRFDELVVETPATYTNKKGEEKKWSGNAHVCQAWKAEQDEAGRIILSSEDRQNALLAAEMARQACPIIAECRVEVVLQWYDADTGVLCRGRVDFWSEDALLFGDLKTCLSANVEDLSRAARRYGYWEQLLFYRDGFATLLGVEAQPYILAVQKHAPFLAAQRPWDMNVGVGEARMAYRHFLKTVKHCRATGVWPGYATEYIRPDPFTWSEDHYDDGTGEVLVPADGGGKDDGELPGALGF